MYINDCYNWIIGLLNNSCDKSWLYFKRYCNWKVDIDIWKVGWKSCDCPLSTPKIFKGVSGFRYLLKILLWGELSWLKFKPITRMCVLACACIYTYLHVRVFTWCLGMVFTYTNSQYSNRWVLNRVWISDPKEEAIHPAIHPDQQSGLRDWGEYFSVTDGWYLS